jgi:hypothetical protein
MASFLLRHPILSPFTLTSTLCLTSIVAYPIVSAPFRQRHRLDTIPSSAGSRQYADYKNNAKTPLIKKDGKLNVRALRQISAGSILGMLYNLIRRKEVETREVGSNVLNLANRPCRRLSSICILETIGTTHRTFSFWCSGTPFPTSHFHE